jgi:nucleoside-diphosphate-sugar epimerase
MAKYLVTGGAGFIGSNLVGQLLTLGHGVRVIDNLSTGKFENLIEYNGSIEFICADLADYRAAVRAVEGVDYVLHQAAIPSVPRSIQDPLATNQSIVTATVNLLKACVEAGGVKRVVQAASSSAYGNTPTLPKREDMIPNPMSPYAVAKLTQEYYGRAFYNIHALEVLSLRYFNIFGPRQDPDSFYSAVIPKFIKLMMRGERPPIFGDGSTSRDFTYIDNVVQANLLAAVCPWPGQSETINIGCGERLSLNDLVKHLNQILGTQLSPRYGPSRQGDVRDSLADLEKARRILNYRVEIPVQEGLRRLVAWYESKPAAAVRMTA